MRDIGGVFVVGVLVADRFRGVQIANLSGEPCSSIFAASFAGQRKPPLPQMFVEKGILFARHVADGANSKGLQFLLGYLADAGNVSHVKGRKESCLLSGHHIEHTVRLGLT